MVINVVPVNNRALQALRTILSWAARGRLEIDEVPRGSATGLSVTHGGSRSVLVPYWAGKGFPSDVERLLRGPEWAELGGDAVAVVVARKLSPATRERLSREGIAWADEAGNAWIEAPGLLVVLGAGAVPSRPDEGRRRQSEQMRWSEGASAVAELILQMAADRAWREGRPPLRIPSVAEIAERVGISRPFVSRTLQQLDRNRWTTKTGTDRGPMAARVLTDAAGLLDHWAGWYTDARRPALGTHALISDPDAFATEVARTWPPGAWALTGWLALEHRAPYMTSTPTIDLYLDRDLLALGPELDRLLTAVRLRRVAQGARVLLHPADAYLLNLLEDRNGASRAGVPEVSDVRLYGDLLGSGVRGTEAAAHLRAERIGF